MTDLKVQIGSLHLKNPVIAASGTFGYGLEYADLLNLADIGAIITKGITLNPRTGNPYPRMAETQQGMLNCVGLQNKGVDHFCNTIYPKIKNIGTTLIANVCGSTPDDYAQCAARINSLEHIQAIELNISCPNVIEGGMAFGISCKGTASVVKAVRQAYDKTLIVKLSPNVTSIADIAKTAQDNGADAISLINTLLGMAVNIETRRPLLSITTGGLSGPAIKPVALRMVRQAVQAVSIPIIGIGGITCAHDALEFLLCGATAVEIGTANFIDPLTIPKTIKGIENFLNCHKIDKITDYINTLKT